MINLVQINQQSANKFKVIQLFNICLKNVQINYPEIEVIKDLNKKQLTINRFRAEILNLPT